MSLTLSEFEYLAEWKVRRIPEPPTEPKESYDDRLKTWVLSSMGIEGAAQGLFIYLENAKMATLEDLAGHLKMGLDEAQDHVDLLYTVGLVEKVGKAYYVRERLSSSITKRLIPRITESLMEVARAESRTRSDADYYLKMRGRAFSDVGEAVVACKEVSRMGVTPVVRIVGNRGYDDESVGVEGLALEYGHDPKHLVVLSESGERVVVGGKYSRGVDVKAHTVIVRGEKDE